ncbi:MAG TPA: M20 family metallo-hydrolase [bacterium]|nr:M20 family metallo-hydrolase [bacterium]
MSQETLGRILDRIDEYREHVIDMQTRLTAIPAIGPDNGGEGEAEKMRCVLEFLNDLDPNEIVEINAPDNRVPAGYRPNLFVRFKGSASTRTIWVMSHMDIVPPGDLSLWNSDPYQVVEKDGKLYGRGTEDDQQGFISPFLALKAMKEEGITPAFNVGLAIVSDEESGSKFGIQHALKERPDLFSKEDLIYIPDAGDPEGITMEVAEKSILWIKVETLGKQTHGSTPEKGINAHKAAAHLVVKMNDLYRDFPDTDPLYDPPVSTFEPTRKMENVSNINTIPGSDIVFFDCRVLPRYSLENLKHQARTYADEIEKEFGVRISLGFPQDETAPDPTSPDAPAVQTLKKAIHEIHGKNAKAVGIGGGTVAAYFRRAGLPAVCWCTLDDTLHGPNEYSVIKNVLNDAKVFAHIFLQR